MKMYENMETGEVMTLAEVREHFYGFAKENPKAYDCMSFNEFLNNATGNNGILREIVDRYLVVGHDYTHRGEFEYGFHDTLSDAVNTLCQDDTLQCIGSKAGCRCARYVSDNDSLVYEIYRVNTPYIVVRWEDKDTTHFDIFNFDNENDAYRAVINDMQSFLSENNNKEMAVWFGNNEGRIDYDGALYRWDIIENF